jgi:large subunit ribosomal protein L25
MEKRRQAMLEMPDLIREWKKVGKRNWDKFPKNSS